MKLGNAIWLNKEVIIASKGDEWRVLDITTNMLNAIDSSADTLEMAFRRGQVVKDAQFLAPILRPGKIIAIGRNYAQHARETNHPLPTSPLMFAKLPSSVIGPNDVIEWNTALTDAVDYEAELAVVIGRTARRVDRDQALDYVFGYTCANDVTARDLQNGDGQWTRAKGLDTFCPLGPWIVTADDIPDPQLLTIRCTVNDDLRQNSSTQDMVFDVKALVAHASQAFTLYPGDIILTGTPSGVGDGRDPKAFLHDGYRVSVEIDRIGRLDNTCREIKET